MSEKEKEGQLKNSRFQIEEDSENSIISIINNYDEHQMNWVEEGKHWGKLTLPDGMEGTVQRFFSKEGNLVERYTFVNKRETDYFGLKGEIGITVPLPDNYKSAEICMKKRCHAHIWCGMNQSYIAAVRMGGTGSNLGLMLTDGSIYGYSIQRNEEAISNDRGSIILHPQIEHLMPGEAAQIDWELFWFQDMREFQKIVESYGNSLSIHLNKAVLFPGEEMEMQIVCGSNYTDSSMVEIIKNGLQVPYEKEIREGKLFISIRQISMEPEEQNWQIKVDQNTTSARIFILPDIDELVKKRCGFIARKQQYHNAKSSLDGAFLIYDNEEQKVYYSENYDHNGGRERVGMGVLLAAYLQKQKNPEVEKSLEKFKEYVYRELYDEMTGIVYNDVGRNNQWHRLYNYPWMAVFFMECYKLYGESYDMQNMYKVLRTYYEQGGKKFYAIGIPMTESIEILGREGLVRQAEKLQTLYQEHADYIAETGLRYPAHEVNYEQSIVAPAVHILLQVYKLTKKEKYLKAAEEQLKVLELFNGNQPDYHLYETAIRHWDGYWFGKRKNFGDTFPHYWSALSGIDFKQYAAASGNEEYEKRAENSLRGVLSLIKEDGSASCAYVYPDSVNSKTTGYYDPWANDQDWGLYFYM